MEHKCPECQIVLECITDSEGEEVYVCPACGQRFPIVFLEDYYGT